MGSDGFVVPRPRGLPPDAPAPPPSPVSASPGRRRRKTVLLTVAVVAVAVVVVVALLVTGALPGLGPGSGGSTGDALSFSAAHSMANSAAAGVSGGPWSLYGAEGIDVTTPAPYSLGVPNGIGSFESIHYLASARPGVPADGSPLTSGLSPWWVFQYSNGTTTAGGDTVTLVVLVVNGTAIALAVESDVGAVGVPPPLPTASIADSPVVVSAAVASNSSFFAAHPALNASLMLFPNGPGGLGEGWLAVFTTCFPGVQIFGAGGSTYPGRTDNLNLNATTGSAVPGGGLVAPATCSTLG